MMKVKGSGDEGSAELLVLVFTLVLQLIFWQASQQFALAWGDAYQGLESYTDELNLEPPPDIEAWGRSWSALPPRIDYGAFFERQRDAEALCYYRSFVDSEAAGSVWRCD